MNLNVKIFNKPSVSRQVCSQILTGWRSPPERPSFPSFPRMLFPDLFRVPRNLALFAFVFFPHQAPVVLKPDADQIVMLRGRAVTEHRGQVGGALRAVQPGGRLDVDRYLHVLGDPPLLDQQLEHLVDLVGPARMTFVRRFRHPFCIDSASVLHRFRANSASFSHRFALCTKSLDGSCKVAENGNNMRPTFAPAKLKEGRN